MQKGLQRKGSRRTLRDTAARPSRSGRHLLPSLLGASEEGGWHEPGERSSKPKKPCKTPAWALWRGILRVCPTPNPSARSTTASGKDVEKPVYDYQGVAFHAFRKACGSLLLAQGKTLKQVQGWLRHSQLTTTMNVYIHQVDDGLGGADAWDEIRPGPQELPPRRSPPRSPRP